MKREQLGSRVDPQVISEAERVAHILGLTRSKLTSIVLEAFIPVYASYIDRGYREIDLLTETLTAECYRKLNHLAKKGVIGKKSVDT